MHLHQYDARLLLSWTGTHRERYTPSTCASHNAPNGEHHQASTGSTTLSTIHPPTVLCGSGRERLPILLQREAESGGIPFHLRGRPNWAPPWGSGGGRGLSSAIWTAACGRVMGWAVWRHPLTDTLTPSSGFHCAGYLLLSAVAHISSLLLCRFIRVSVWLDQRRRSPRRR